MNKKTLPEQEWNFWLRGKGERDWSPSEWEACYFYEFARESPKIRQAVSQFRQRCPGGSFQGYIDFAFKPFARSKLPNSLWKYELFNFCPEWPDEPFLALPLGERKRRIKIKAETVRAGTTIVEQCDINFILNKYKSLAAKPLSGEETILFLKGMYDDPLDNGRRTIITEPGKELACFEIDWRHPKTKILNAFKNWLDRCPPDKVALLVRNEEGKLVKADDDKTMLGAAPYEMRGKGSETATLQNRLLSLGVLRIWRFCGASWENTGLRFPQAAEVLGDQFDHQSAWVRARNTAEETIAEFNG